MFIDDFLCDNEIKEKTQSLHQEKSFDVMTDNDNDILLQEMMEFNLRQQRDKFQTKAPRKEPQVNKTLNTYDEVDNLLDVYIINNFKTIPSFKSLLDPLKGKHVKNLRVLLSNSREEIHSVLTTEDEDLIDAYSNFSKSEIKKIVGFYDAVLSECDRKIGVTNKLRKPRKKKDIPLEKILAKVQYCEEFKDLNLKSFHPREILGASKVWVYNVVYRKLGCYHADNQEGFSIKGTTILNFNEDRSIQKILRKPKDVLTRVLVSDNVVLNKIMDSLRTTEIKLTGRLNKDTIILRIIGG